MADLAQRQDLAESAVTERDMGKHNNATTGFKALAKKAGGGEKGNRIAGAQFQKMKRAGQLEETDVEEAEFRSTAFNKSKESLDAATAFVGIIARDKYVATLKSNTDLAKYEDIANDLYKKAQDLQMIDRGGALGGKIVTPTGEYKVLEINTNTRIVADMTQLDWSNLTTFIQTNGFTNVHCIIPMYDKGFATKLSEICDNIGGITFLSHETSDNSITVPYIEDNENTFISLLKY